MEDLQACLHHLFSLGVSSPPLTALTACSAGAVPVGALCNRHPHMMRAVTLQVTCEIKGDLLLLICVRLGVCLVSFCIILSKEQEH